MLAYACPMGPARPEVPSGTRRAGWGAAIRADGGLLCTLKVYVSLARLSNSGFEAPSGFDDVKRVPLDEVSRLIDIEFDFKLHGVAAPYGALE